MMRLALVVGLLVTFAAQGLLRPASGGAQAAAAQPSITVLGGAVRPLFVAATWLDAEAALEDRRLLDALDRLRVLEATDPAGWEAAAFRAHLIAHNLAEREDSSGRADRVVEAIRILDAAAERTRDPGPSVAKGQLLLEPRMWEQELAAAIERRLGESPRALATGALEEAARRAPASHRIGGLLVEARRLLAVDLLMRDEPASRALEPLEAADELAGRLPGDSLGRRLARSWAAALGAALGGDAGAIDSAARRFMDTLAEWARVAPPSDPSEAVLAAELARRLPAIARQRFERGDPRSSLSLLELVHSIRQFVATRLGPISSPRVPTPADRRRIHDLLDRIAADSPDLAPRITKLKASVSAW